MSNITWGAEIEVNGVRPEWLKDGDKFRVWNATSKSQDFDGPYEGFYWHEISGISLPVSHRFYQKKKEYDVIDIEDWAIEAAKNDVDCDWTLGQLKAARYSSNTVVKAVLVLARMIQKHEQHRKPVDPDVIAVRDILLAWGAEEFDLDWGDYAFEAALTAYKAAKS